MPSGSSCGSRRAGSGNPHADTAPGARSCRPSRPSSFTLPSQDFNPRSPRLARAATRQRAAFIPPAAPLEERPAGIRKGTPAIRGHGSRVILSPSCPGRYQALAVRNGSRVRVQTATERASHPRYFVALKHAKSPCRARQSTPAYPIARSASKCRTTERRPGSWSLKTSGATTKSALRNRPPTDNNS